MSVSATLPLAIDYSTSATSGIRLKEFQTGEVIPPEHGGTGVSSLDDLIIGDYTLSGEVSALEEDLLEVSAAVSNLEGDFLGVSSTVYDNSASWGGGGGTSDHGSLSGLGDNDHPQYVLSSTNATLSSTVTTLETELDGVSSTVFDNSATWENHNHYDNEVLVSGTIGSPPIQSVADLHSNLFSPGVVSGGSVIDNGDGTITIPSGAGIIRASDSDSDPLLPFSWASGSPALADNDLNYVYIEYNGGSPQIVATTTKRTDLNTNLYMASVHKTSTFLHPTDQRMVVGNVLNHANDRMVEVDGLAHAGGAVFTETGTRNLSVTEGTYWLGLTRIVTMPGGQDTSVSDNFLAFYRDGVGGWNVQSAQTQINNTQYDDGTGTLATITNNRYGVHWVYVGVDDEFYTVYGRGDYKLNEAQEATAPSDLPPHLQENHSTLAAKIIILKSSSTFESLESAYDTVFITGGATDHGDLAGLGDNDHPQYVLSATNLTLSSSVTTLEGELDGVSSTVFDNSASWAVDTDTTDHTALTNIGTRTHAELDGLYTSVNSTSGTWDQTATDLDSHEASATVHFTEASIDHGSIAGLGDDDHTQYTLADGSRSMDTLDVTGNATVDGNVGIGVVGTPTAPLQIEGVGTADAIYIESSDAGADAGPVITLKRDSASPASADYLGQLKFKGESDTGAERVYAKITAKIDDPTNTAEDGVIEFMNRFGGSEQIALRLKENSFRTVNGVELHVDGNTGLGNNNPSEKLDVTGNIKVSGTVDGRDVAADGTKLDTVETDLLGVSGTVFDSSGGWEIQTKAITVESPTNTEDISIFYTDVAITIEKMTAVLRGSATPSVTWTIRHNSDRSAAGTEVVTGGTATTNTTTGEQVTVFNDATIPAGSFVWLETTAQSGTVDTLHITIKYTYD